MARRPLIRDVTRMRVSTAAFQKPIFVDNDPSKGVAGFAPGINPAVLRATDAIVHDVSNATRSISDEYGMINRGEKTMYTADDFSGVSPVYAGTAEKDFYVPREFEDNLRTVMEHVSDKWDSNLLTPSAGGVGLNPQYYHEKLVGRTRIYKTQAAMRKAMQEILRRGGMTESAATAKNPYRLTEWLPMSETDYNAAVAAGTLSQATSRLFRGTTPEADRIARNDRARERQRQQEEAAREAQRRADEQRRINERASRSAKQRQKREGRMYANSVWNQFKEQERREKVQARSAARKKELDERREAAESERMKHRVLTVLAGGVTLIIALLRRISQSISEIASAGTITVPKTTIAIEGVDLSAPLANALLEQLEKLDIFGIVSPLINAAVEKVGEIYNNRMTSLYSGIPEDKQRWYNMIDQAHGLESGTFVAGVVGLGQRFANVTDIEGEIDTVTKLAPVLGAKLTQDLVKLAVPGSGVDAASLAENILNAYFQNYQEGLNAYNKAESDPSKRYRSLTENLANLSPELASILRQMITDSLPGSIWAGFSDYEGWAFASRSAQLYAQGIIGEPSAATTNAAYQWQQSWNDLNATLQKVFDERILKDMLGVLQSLLYTVTAIMAKYIMNESQQMQFYGANRAALEAERERVDARYSAAELAVRKAFGWDDEDFEAFRKASVKGRGKDMELALPSRSYTQEQLDALGTWAQALKWQQSLEDEIRSETPIYIGSLWSDETFAWAAEGTRAGIASTMGPSKMPSTPSSPKPSLSLDYVSSLMPEGAVSYYENYYMSLEKALAKGIAAADAGDYNSDYRFDKLNQVDYMDAFINAGAKLLGELDNDPNFVGGVSFGTLQGGQFRSGNDITRAGMVSLQDKIDWLARNNPELLERIKAQALTDLYRQEGGIKWGPTSREYSDMVSWALAAWQQDVAAGKVPAETFTGSWPAELNPDLAEIVEARRKAAAALTTRMLLSGAFGTLPGDSAERDAYAGALRSFAEELVGKLVGMGVEGAFDWKGGSGIGFSQQQRNGEMRIILDVKTDSGREEYDITDDFNRVMSGYNTSSEMRINTGK